VQRSVGEFVRVLVEAVVIVLAVSFISLGLHFRPLRLDIWPGLVVGGHDSAGAGHHLRHHVLLGHRACTRSSLGSLIIALGLLVDDAIIAVEMMVRKLEEGTTSVMPPPSPTT
jgi:multidrug efflux pump